MVAPMTIMNEKIYKPIISIVVNGYATSGFLNFEQCLKDAAYKPETNYTPEEEKVPVNRMWDLAYGPSHDVGERMTDAYFVLLNHVKAPESKERVIELLGIIATSQDYKHLQPTLAKNISAYIQQFIAEEEKANAEFPAATTSKRKTDGETAEEMNALSVQLLSSSDQTVRATMIGVVQSFNQYDIAKKEAAKKQNATSKLVLN